MQGDDWLLNASTRDDFGNYVEGILEADAKKVLRAVEEHCNERGIAYKSVMLLGDPAECLLKIAAQEVVTMVVIGPPRPKGETGLRSRMELEKLARGLSVPLLMAARTAS